MAINKKQRLIAGLSLNKLADLLISTKTTLTALLLTLGAPTWMIGWLVPIRESGALLPQALISYYLRQHKARHHIWRLGIVTQGSCVVVMLLAALFLDGAQAGFAILGALIMLSIGRSACSLTVKDMEADVAKKGERGGLIGMASTLSGVATLAVALPLFIFNDALDSWALAGLIGLSAVIFFCTLLCMWPIKTSIESDDASGSLFSVHFDATVYKFIFVRGLFVHSALVAPYFMIQKGDNASELLPVYIAAEALAALLSSIVWGKVADKSATLTLQMAGGLALAACIGLLSITNDSLFVSAGLFFVLSIAHAGVRTGRKTYSLDVKEGQERTELVGFSNTAIGLILLAFGGFYALLTPNISFSVVYIMASVLFVAMLATLILPKEK